MKKRRVLLSILSLGLSLALLIAWTARSRVRTHAASRSQGVALDTSFTYQGQLKVGATPVDGDCDMAFRLYDGPATPAQIADAITRTIPITDGLFTVDLGFGAGAFNGDARWLGIAVRCAGDAGFATFERQPLTAAPQALYALGAPWSGLSGLPAGFADGVDDVSMVVTGTNTFAGTGLTQLIRGNTITLSVAFGGSDGDYGAAASVARSDHAHDGSYWSLSGNSGTLSATHFLGTTDSAPLELHVGGERALRLEPYAGHPNLIGGSSSNSATVGVIGSTIAGGGTGAGPNRVTDDYGTVGGGTNNQAGDAAGATDDAHHATVAGGDNNTASGRYATIPGGQYNTAQGDYSYAAGRRARADHAGAFVWADSTDADWASTGSDQFLVRATGGLTLAVGSGGLTLLPDATSPNIIAGASSNSVTVGAYGAAVGGGSGNQVTAPFGSVGGGEMNGAGDRATAGGGVGNTASGQFATVPGGSDNTAQGSYSFAAGHRAKAYHSGVFVWADSTNTDYASTGDDQFLVRASGGVTMRVDNGRLTLLPHATSPNFIAGHSDNHITAGVYGATIVGGGGSAFPNQVSDEWGTVGGGRRNRAGDDAGTTSDARYGTVGGGYYNLAGADYATVGGGSTNAASAAYATIAGGSSNTASDPYTAVGGGTGNTASGNGATIGGGESNATANNYTTVGGGWNNAANVQYATVSGGNSNTASGSYATVAGGESINATGKAAAVAGGLSNDAGGTGAAIGGGAFNATGSAYATVPGGYWNEAQGKYSFAAGRRAKANHPGAFVWADSQDFDFSSIITDQFSVRATGGISFVVAVTTTSGDPTWACSLANGSSWSCTSDRDLKEGLLAVDGSEVLRRLSRVPIFTWNARGQDPPIRHIGPMAQDFFAAFSVGADDRHIATIDLDGVALAAIQGLYRLSQHQASRIAQLEADRASQEQRMDSLEARLSALEAAGAPRAIQFDLPGGWLALGAFVMLAGAFAQRRHPGGGR